MASAPKPEVLVPAVMPELITGDGDDMKKGMDVKDSENEVPSSPGHGIGSEMEGTGALVTTIDNEGPIVTRRELWAYYCKYYNKDIRRTGEDLIIFILTVYYNGDNVSLTFLLMQVSLKPPSGCRPPRLFNDPLPIPRHLRRIRRLPRTR